MRKQQSLWKFSLFQVTDLFAQPNHSVKIDVEAAVSLF